MTLSFCSFSSGSSGNCYLVKTETTAVLVDAGISCSKITDGLLRTGTDPGQLKAILVTHEHTDHINGVKTALKKYKHISAYGTKATFSGMKYEPGDDRKRVFTAGDSFTIGDLEIESFAVSHDAADPVGYSIRHEGKQVSILTDTGSLNENMMSIQCRSIRTIVIFF